MSFPIRFTQGRGDYDFISPIINCAGNAAVVAAGATALAVITHLALKALGFSGFAATIPTAIPGAVAVLGGAAAIAGLAAIGFVAWQFAQALGRR
jgi:hypothetical protein